MRRRRQYITVAPWSVARGTRVAGSGSGRDATTATLIQALGIPLRGRTFARGEGTAPPFAVARGAEDAANLAIVLITSCGYAS